MNPELSSKFMLSDHKTVTVFGKTLSQQKHDVLQSTAPLQLKRFKVDMKMAIAASAPVLPNQKETVLQNRPIHWRTLYNISNSVATSQKTSRLIIKKLFFLNRIAIYCETSAKDTISFTASNILMLK